MFQQLGGRSFGDSDSGEFNHSNDFTVSVSSTHNHPSPRGREWWFDTSVPLKYFQSKSPAQNIGDDCHFDLYNDMRTQIIDPSVDFMI